MKYMIISLIAVMTSGCASFTSPARSHELDQTKSYWMDYDVTRRGTIVSNANAKWKSCAEPAPDAAIGLVAKLEGSLNVAEQGEANAKGELTQSIVKMAEKTQMVMFLRESMYRLCELSINTDMDAEKTIELYVAVINASLALVEKEKVEAEKGKVEAERGKIEAELEMKRLESADQAKFIFEYLYENKVDPDVIQRLLKEIPD
jgi:hypothetical protein